MHRAKLSANINKYALVRNSRGANRPDLLQSADRCIRAGAHGITAHPRLDQRHVRFDDILPLAAHLRTHHPGIEYNIECEPVPELVDRILEAHPDQCTLVPVSPGEVTSDHGWALPTHSDSLRPIAERLSGAGIRVSLFMDCDPESIRHAAEVGADRVELYTGPYAEAWGTERGDHELEKIRSAARAASEVGLGLNAGHDLDRHNLIGIASLPELLEVSIGHAMICRALEVGTSQAIRELLSALGWPPRTTSPDQG